MNLIQFYIQSSTEIELGENKAALATSVKAGERDFFAKY